MNQTPKTLGQMVEEIIQAKYDQEAEWKRLAAADQQLQGLTLWTIPDLVEALTRGRVHIAPGHDPALTAPTSAQEAFELAWNLAYPVKEGQVIPAGTRYLQWVEGNLREYTEHLGITVTKGKSILARTVDPLPATEPDWLDAPAVLASMNDCSSQKVWLPKSDGHWECTCCGTERHWSKMADVTPLYPKEDTPHDAPRQRTISFHDDKPWGTKLGGDPA